MLLDFFVPCIIVGWASNYLYTLAMILKNWPIDTKHECNFFAKFDLGDSFASEVELIDDQENELQVAGSFKEDPTF
jgi:hypothetical protein